MLFTIIQRSVPATTVPCVSYIPIRKMFYCFTMFMLAIFVPTVVHECQFNKYFKKYKLFPEKLNSLRFLLWRGTPRKVVNNPKYYYSCPRTTYPRRTPVSDTGSGRTAQPTAFARACTSGTPCPASRPAAP